nr:hypothetical protein [Burkholderia contaminans]
MKKSKFTEEQIAYALKQAELGTPVAEVWPIAPRPFYEKAFGGWLCRVAARYQMSVAMLL